MKIVVDASVAVKWLRPEPGSLEARALATVDAELLAPSLLPIEVANVLWRLVRLKHLKRANAHHLLGLLAQAIPSFEPAAGLLPRALALSMVVDHPVHDCLYVALAEREGATLVTDDRRLSALAPKLKGVSIKALRP